MSYKVSLASILTITKRVIEPTIVDVMHIGMMRRYVPFCEWIDEDALSTHHRSINTISADFLTAQTVDAGTCSSH
jgi:hypothetical protein